MPPPLDTDVLIIGGGLAGLVAALRVLRPETAASFPARVKVIEADRPGGLLNWGGRNSFHIAGPKYKFTEQDWDALVGDAQTLGVEWVSGTVTSASLAGPIKEVAIDGAPTLRAHAVIIASGAFSMKNAAHFRPVDGLITTFGSPTAIRLKIQDLMGKTGRKKLLFFGTRTILELARMLADLRPTVLVEPPYEGVLPAGAHLGSLERILGEPRIFGIEYRDAEGALQKLDCDTIYADFNACMERTMATRFLHNSGVTVDKGFVVTDREMATNLPGVFAAGDVTGGTFAVSKSIYEGNCAGFSALAYLHSTLYGFEPNLHPFRHGAFSLELGLFYRRPGTHLHVNGNALEAEAPGTRVRYELTPELIPLATAVTTAGGAFRADQLGVPVEGLGTSLLFALVRIGVLGVGAEPSAALE